MQPGTRLVVGGYGRLCRGKDRPPCLCCPYAGSKCGICWRNSPNEQSVRDRGVGGSNPLAPTNFQKILGNLQNPVWSVTRVLVADRVPRTECAVLQTTPVSIERPEILGA